MEWSGTGEERRDGGKWEKGVVVVVVRGVSLAGVSVQACHCVADPPGRLCHSTPP